ncbi:MAG: hypothetical protein WD468_05605, partial [Pirellulales bacterium]
FPPLLSAGFHEMTLVEVRELCVTAFPKSLTRKSVMEGLVRVIDKLNRASVIGEVWVDGSFATRKIDASDADILVHVASELYDSNLTVRDAVWWATLPERKDTDSCDSYRWVEYSKGHPKFTDSESDRLYWTNWYGYSEVRHVAKGIIVVSLPAVIA